MGKIVIWLKLSLCASFTTIAIIISIVEGALDFGNIFNFDVRITNAELDHVEISEQVIQNDGTSLVFTTNELKKVGDISVLDYEISNYSKTLDASVQVDCVQNNDQYYTIHNEFPSTIKANSKEKGSLVVILEKSSATEISDNFSCSLNVTAVNKENSNYHEYLAIGE